MSRVVLALCALAAFVTACSRYGERDIEWTENVTLSSGATVVIDRVQQVEFHATSDGASGDPAKMSTIKSASNPPAFPPWQAKMLPILLDRDPDSEAWVLVATMSTCMFWGRNGAPEPPYWAFRVVGNTWHRTNVPKAFWDRPSNMFAGFVSRDTSSFVQSTYSARRDAQARGPREAIIGGVHSVGVESKCGPAAPGSGFPREMDLGQFGEE